MNNPSNAIYLRRLPVELIANVLQECEKETLVDCALVCRDWLSLARPRLFESITYRPRHRHDLEVSDDAVDPLGDLLNFLRGNRDIGKLVRRLVLGTESRSWAMARCLVRLRAVKIIPCKWRTFIDLLLTLPRLRTLELESLFLEPCDATHPICPNPLIAHLEHLTYGCQGSGKSPEGDLRDVFHVLSIFARVDCLSFRPFVLHTTDSAALAARITTDVRALSIPPYAPHIMEYLPALPALARLERFVLPLLLPGGVAHALRLLDPARATLRDVALQFPGIDSRGASAVRDLRALRLAACPCLEGLRFTLPLGGVAHLLPAAGVAAGRPYFTAEAYAYITELVERCAPGLRRVVFDLWLALQPYDCFQDMQPVMLQTDWSALDAVLALRVARGLEKVEFCHASDYMIGMSRMEAYFAERMPKLWRTGKARFVGEVTGM